MKKIRIIELLANIRSNIIAFFSISMFVCLGIGLFLGIQWGAVALRNAYQESLEKGNMHDIEISFPYGITQSDLKKIEEIDGVSAIEYGYSSYAVMKDGSTSYTLKMQSMPNEIDKPIAVVGNLPMENNEVALLKKWAEKKNIGIGDTVSLKHDATDDDADGMQYLRESTFTVTALVDSPAYLYNQSTAYGVSNIGSGDVDCVAFVKKDVFDAEKYRDGYPSVYIRCTSLDGISTFSDEYKNKISPIVDKLTELGGTLGTARYNEIHDDAQTKIEDAQKKLNEGESELEKGQQQLAEGEKALEEGKEQLEAGQSELINSVTSASSQQGDAQRQLEAAYKQLADGQAQYDAGLQTYNAAVNIYNQLHAKFESIRPTYDELMGAYSSLNAHYSTLVSLQNQTERALDSYKAAPEEEKDAQWAEVASSYQSLYEAIQGVENLTIKAAGPHRARIVAVPRYSEVLYFEDCSAITLSGFTAGHNPVIADQGCAGGVLSFSNCRDFKVEDCSLFGCGIVGVSCMGCFGGEVVRTEIHDCSDGACYFYDSRDIALTDCNIHDIGSYYGSYLYQVYSCRNITVNGSALNEGTC